MACVQRARPIAGQSGLATGERSPGPYCPLSLISATFSERKRSVKGARVCAACEPLTDRFRSDTQFVEGKGAGSQGACPLAEYEAAPHGAP